MKNILVAGGTDGIGLAFVKQLDPKQYDNIYVLGRDFLKIETLMTPKVTPLWCDITDSHALTEAIESIDAPIDQFVNTIGTFYRKPIEAISPNDVSQHFEVNTIGNINLTNLVLPKLNAQFAQVLVCSATLAIEARENYALQSATKAAYRYYIDTLRKEKKDTLKVIAVYPSSVNTGIFKKFGDLRDTDNYPSPDKIAAIMEFLLSQPREIYIPELKVENFA